MRVLLATSEHWYAHKGQQDVEDVMLHNLFASSGSSFNIWVTKEETAGQAC